MEFEEFIQDHRILITSITSSSSVLCSKEQVFVVYCFKSRHFIFFFNLFLFIYFWLRWVFVAAQAFSSCGERGLLLGAQASHWGGFSCEAWGLGARASVVAARGLQSAGSVAVVHRLSCSTACGIFPDQGSNLCPLHWQADS